MSYELHHQIVRTITQTGFLSQEHLTPLSSKKDKLPVTVMSTLKFSFASLTANTQEVPHIAYTLSFSPLQRSLL